jgi:hypothetical protein
MKPTFETIGFELQSVKDFQNEDVAKAVLSTINSFGLDFIPQKYDIYEPEKFKYNPNDIENVVKLWLNEENARKVAKEHGVAAGQVLLKKKAGHKVSYMMMWDKGREARFNNFIISVDIKYFKDKHRQKRFLDLSRQIMLILEPVHGRISNRMFPDWYEALNLHVRLPDILWVTLFGKPYIDLFGREKILSTPCYKVEEINHDLIWLQATENLFEPVPNEVKNAIKTHLGADAFVWDGRDYRYYKPELVPKFDFSALTID